MQEKERDGQKLLGKKKSKQMKERIIENIILVII